MTYYEIACFLNNTRISGKRLDADDDLATDVIDRFTPNLIAEPFRQLTSDDLLDFPELTERQLFVLFTGTYQLSQATSYLAKLFPSDRDVVEGSVFERE